VYELLAAIVLHRAVARQRIASAARESRDWIARGQTEAGFQIIEHRDRPREAESIAKAIAIDEVVRGPSTIYIAVIAVNPVVSGAHVAAELEGGDPFRHTTLR